MTVHPAAVGRAPPPPRAPVAPASPPAPDTTVFVLDSDSDTSSGASREDLAEQMEEVERMAVDIAVSEAASVDNNNNNFKSEAQYDPLTTPAAEGPTPSEFH